MYTRTEATAMAAGFLGFACCMFATRPKLEQQLVARAHRAAFIVALVDPGQNNPGSRNFGIMSST